MTDTVQVEIRQLPHGEGLALPAYQSAHAAGLDLLAAVPEDAPMILAPGKHVIRYEFTPDAARPGTGGACALYVDDKPVLSLSDGTTLHCGAIVITGGRGGDVILDIMGGPYLAGNLGALASWGRLEIIATRGGSRHVPRGSSGAEQFAVGFAF